MASNSGATAGGGGTPSADFHIDLDGAGGADVSSPQPPASPDYGDLRGNMSSASVGGSGPGGRQKQAAPDYDSQFDTLDEPVWHTVRRDLHAVGIKFTHVLYPKREESLLKDWDLWGPLFICVLLSLVLQGTGAASEKGPQFTDVFIITFFGSVVVTLNIQLLGGKISFFQSLCVLGYCLLPTAAAAVLCRLIVAVAASSLSVLLIRLGITVLGFSWATYASTAFLAGTHPPRRKALAVYPIFLFYFVISWMVASHSN